MELLIKNVGIVILMITSDYVKLNLSYPICFQKICLIIE